MAASAGETARLVCGCILLCGVLPVCAIYVAAAQEGKAENPVEAARQQPPIRVQSNLILVPVFVYPKYGLERMMSVEEQKCDEDNHSAFLILRADQPYSPKNCLGRDRQVRDLTTDDFQLFQDGEPQKIQLLGKEYWELTTRDNRAWHDETSIAPSGVWSTTDQTNAIKPAFHPQNYEFYYILGYSAPRPDEICHRIRVEVRRPPGARVFARDEYCALQTPSDLLNGTKIGKKLQHELEQKGHDKIPLSVQAGIFRGSAGSRADVVLEFPWKQMNHSWDVRDGTLTAQIAVLGAVYTEDGTLVTRFSDLLWPSYWPTILKGYSGSAGLRLSLPNDDPVSSSVDISLTKEVLSWYDPAWLPTRYETQFGLAPGEYDLRVVLSDGTKIGRAEVRLTVENYDAKSLSLGSVFLRNRFRDAHVAAVESAAANFAPQYVPLVSKGVRVTPAGDTRFGPETQLSAYFEIYGPQAAIEPAPQIQAHLRIVNAKNSAIVKDFSPVDTASYAQAGNTTIPVAREIPIATLAKGEYRLEVQASDSTGRSTPWRSANFTIIDKK